MRVNFYLRRPKIDGMSAIYASICYNSNRLIIFPGESIHTSGWTNKKGKNEPKASAKNAPLIGRLFQHEALFREIFDELKAKYTKVEPEIFGQTIREKLDPSLVVEKNAPIYIVDFFQTMIDDSTTGKRKTLEDKQLTISTIRTYETTKKHFGDFQYKHKRKYYLSSLDQKLIDGFANYLTHDLKLAYNGCGKYMKTFKTMMNYARQLKLIGADVFIDNKVKVTHEATDNIYLTMKDIKDIWALTEFDSPLYEFVRDLFIIGCLTGLRFSDYSTLAKARIDNHFIYLTQQKTHGKVTIPIHPIVKQVLSKYPDGLPAAPPNQVFNRYIKEIGKKLPQLDTDYEKVLTREGVPDRKIYKRFEILTSHTCRRSFATNEYLNGTPTITIMAITGHLSEKSFLTYIKADSLQHAMLLADRWRKNDNDEQVA